MSHAASCPDRQNWANSLTALPGTMLAVHSWLETPMNDSRWTAKFEELLDAALPSFVREAALVENGRLYRSIMTRIELPLLRQALELSGGNQLRAARLLGINRNTLRKRLRLLGLLAPSRENRHPLPA